MTFGYDDDAVDDEVRIGFTGAGYLPEYLGDTTITDDDTPRVIVFNRYEPNVDTEGNSSTYTVSLDTSPTSTVTIGRGTLGNNSDQVRVTGFPKYFDANNWDTPQTITVQAIDDYIDDGNLETTIRHTVTSSGDYSGVTAGSLSFRAVDNDMVRP